MTLRAGGPDADMTSDAAKLQHHASEIVQQLDSNDDGHIGIQELCAASCGSRTPSLSNPTEEQLEEISNGAMQRPIVAALGEIANKARNDLLALAQPNES